MTVYNVNLGIGWASSGVEYAQAYRAQSLRKLNVPAKFIFSDLILANNIEDLTRNLGYSDDEIIWFYNFFTNVRIAPSDYPLSKFERAINLKERNAKREKLNGGKNYFYTLANEGLSINVRFHDQEKKTIDQVSYVANGVMVKRDFYSYTKYATEYYNGVKDNNQVTHRDFYNEDGSVAYTQHVRGQHEVFEFPDKIYYSKNDLYLEMLKQLKLTKEDTIILDREDDGNILINGQLIFEHHNPAKLVIVVHADHYDDHYTTKKNVLWNNFYEYQFTHTKDVASFIVATDKQRDLLKKQFKQYQNVQPNVTTIPVGNLKKLTHPTTKRKQHSLITASRLATEKHVDWLIKAVVKAHQEISDVTLDIYGQGGERGRLSQLINQYKAQSYIRLMGQHDLTTVYQKYAAYIAGSTSEGFGLSLLEAVGSGLPMIGFDVPYGNQTFIDDGKNGYLLPYAQDWSDDKKVNLLAEAVVKLFTKADQVKFIQRSYELAEPYLTDNVVKRWGKLLEELKND
ncbi:accessory Sec system glycosyltransferase GtfA [Limosilactobacillus fastidiosus]|uniref:UDP-N-acetylglucosamine--peptide N-acetylglucosaminyltransferase GtfA subunit n=1 Tax=Limosilactobacillus fastidiosus TaxID=2759855 RepID=A0A7W3TZQ9_9LACO|nr:accessory Sec system glycosyltransferase GtfA [Limosilactobacillus fastidiosus]MBB1063799.1 accessory Sec system glycosyltransferase GtfA [Limosilactobacillus fastidiosus]MBB1086262.1 accessory Sec system glycosyltransferase GtfA [Limosilactobacillus fastidiosus]MCD7084374.1 accessory Sec system glycosyltransferase GtfA [Limosilactobacillus fastidiosus]MCD7086462.1 accessory Sec system glycosyltransferase GtfA [Limosilactobacillus fastidiosus]MCD7114468.1 accessory Sec system glycosyltransf